MHIDQWLEKLAQEEQEKQAAADLEGLFAHVSIEDVLKIAQSDKPPSEIAKTAGYERTEQPRAKDVIKGRGPKARAARMALREKLRGGCLVGEEIDKSLGLDKKAQAKLAFMDKVARQIARTHSEIGKTAGYERPDQPRAQDVIPGRGPEVRAARAALRDRLREGCSTGEEIDKTLKAFKRSPENITGRQRIALATNAAFNPHPIERISRAGEKAVKGILGTEKKAQIEGMEKEDAFTSPEAQAKAKVMSRAMKATKGAPPKVVRSAIKMTAKQMGKTASLKSIGR